MYILTGTVSQFLRQIFCFKQFVVGAIRITPFFKKCFQIKITFDKWLYRVVNIPCVLREPITAQGRQGMEEVDFLELAIYMNYFSMRTTLSAGVP